MKESQQFVITYCVSVSETNLYLYTPKNVSKRDAWNDGKEGN